MIWVRRVCIALMVVQIVGASFQPSVRYREPVRNIASAHRILNDAQSAVTHHHQQNIVETVPIGIALLLVLLQFRLNFAYKLSPSRLNIKRIILPPEPQPPRTIFVF